MTETRTLFTGPFRPSAEHPYVELTLDLPPGTQDLWLTLDFDVESFSGDKGHPVLWVFGGKWKRTLGYLTLRKSGLARLRTIWGETENKADARTRLSGPHRIDFTVANGTAAIDAMATDFLSPLAAHLSTPIGSGDIGDLPSPLTIWLGSDNGLAENRPEGIVFHRLAMGGRQDPEPPEPDRIARAVAKINEALAILKGPSKP